MARKPAVKGRLFALEGIRNPDLLAAGKRLIRYLGTSRLGGGVSTWDASAIFFELARTSRRHGTPSAKTLLMLYASDLAFRLRWEIQPAVAEGRTVIAAPYVQTAVAFGVAAGVSSEWVTEMLSFAPEPETTFYIDERDETSYWTGKRSAGFVEFGCATLAAASDRWDQAELRRRFIKYLVKLEKSGRARRVP